MISTVVFAPGLSVNMQTLNCWAYLTHLTLFPFFSNQEVGKLFRFMNLV